jgi:hypothetical protein
MNPGRGQMNPGRGQMNPGRGKQQGSPPISMTKLIINKK